MLSKTAMWLREDNRPIRDEIVLPSDVTTWDEGPSWIDSLLKLRWCCPTSTKTKPTKERSKRKKKPINESQRTVDYSIYPSQQAHNYVPRHAAYSHYPYSKTQQMQQDIVSQQYAQQYHYNAMYLGGNNYQNHEREWGGDPSYSRLIQHGDYATRAYGATSHQSKRPAPLTAAFENAVGQREYPISITPDTSDRLGNRITGVNKKHDMSQKHEVAQQQPQRNTQKNPHRPPLVYRGAASQQQSQQPPLPSQRAESPGPVTPSPAKPPLRNRNPASMTPASPRPPSPSTRPRLHSELSRASAGTGGSRHRRQAHESFEFSANSLNHIVSSKDQQARAKLPDYIEYNAASGAETQVSWSSFDFDAADRDMRFNDEDSLGGDLHGITNSGYVSPMEEKPYRRKPRKKRAEPKATALPAPPLGRTWMFSWTSQGDAAAGRPAKETKAPSQRVDRTSVLSNGMAIYLPRHSQIDRMMEENERCRVIVSGWAAISMSEHLKHKLAVMEGPLQVHRSDIGYFQVVSHIGAEACYSLVITQDDNIVRIPLLDRYSQQVQNHDICGRAGRCVMLVDLIKRQTLCTILPVSLPRFFFSKGKLVDDVHFGKLEPALFAPFQKLPAHTDHSSVEYGYNVYAPPFQKMSSHGDHSSVEYGCNLYAPDEQHDAATHVMFSIDSVLSTGY